MDNWIISQTRPGYREKTIQAGEATVVIYRPILDAEEQTRRERHAMDILSSVARDRVKNQTFNRRKTK